ncbi:2-dehydropantoate 2-reductase [Sphingomonas daechungensis]|uniref:2-dehydropantoate 2-reductase n=1 Tax=Sphingomonas daechungensis TaxID=1176646 RepID=UPI0031E74897
MAAARVVVHGAGSVGCFIGGCWQAAGVPVSFLGRKSFGAEIAEHGLSLSDFAGWKAHLSDVDYRTDASVLADADIIALTVKSGATAEAAQQIADHARDGTLVVSFQNGISNLDVLRRELGGRFKIARGIIQYNVVHLGEGRFHKAVAGALFAEDRPEIRELAAIVADGPAPLKLSDDMTGVAWGKLLINLNNAVNALSGRTLLGEFGERDYRRVVAASQHEGLALLKRAGIQPAKIAAVSPAVLPYVIGSPNWLFKNVFLRKWKIDEKARSSMNDDIVGGRKTEVDYINGELVALAERLGMDAPINRKVVELIRKAEQGAPALGPAELRREVLGR